MLKINEMISLKGFKKIHKTPQKLIDETEFYFSADNRELGSQSAFVAIVGARFNPLSHLDLVKKAGCRVVIYEGCDDFSPERSGYINDLIFIEVGSIIDFIQNLGHGISQKFRLRGGIVMAISGSNGKTTTKEMLRFLLAKTMGEKSVICTQKNNNNHLGVPFTLFSIREETKVAVVELGSNHPGEIKVLCDILNPQYGLTTNIGQTHLEFFGSLQAVCDEESYLQHCCEKLYFVNSDDDLLRTIDLGDKSKTFGEKAKNYKFSFESDHVLVNELKIENASIIGKHNLFNMAVAIVLAKQMGIDDEELSLAASEFSPTANRSEWKSHLGAQVFLDAYNANPSSMRAALIAFFEKVRSIGSGKKKICIIMGDMNELGEHAAVCHKELGQFANSFSPTQIVYIGKYSKEYGGESENIISFDCVESMTSSVVSQIFSNDYVFIKGSRSLQLETILDIR